MAYSFDGFGNLYKKAGTGLAAGASFDFGSSAGAANNRLGGTFDANGNNLSVGVYDFENRMTGRNFSGDSLAYAPDNKLVLRLRAGVENKKLYFYVGNQRLATCNLYPEENLLTHQVVDRVSCNDEVWFAGRRVAVVDRPGSDVSTRMLPYGEEIGSTPSDKVKFATYYRDDGGLDYADQRWYSSTAGRFTSADPYMASGGPADPGSWNRYAYVGGDPVNFGDRSGLMTCWLSGANSGDGGVMAVGQCLTDGTNASTYFAYSVSGLPLTVAQQQELVVRAQEDLDYQDPASGLKTVRYGLRALSRMDFSKCAGLLQSITGQSIGSIRESARMTAGFVFDGTTSPVILDSAQSTTYLIRDFFRQFSSVEAKSTVNGYALYVRPSSFESSSLLARLLGFALVDSGGALTNFGSATLLHEVLHHFPGLTDTQLQLRLKIDVSLDTSNISVALRDRCW